MCNKKELRKSTFISAGESLRNSYIYNIIQFVVTLKSSVLRRKRVPLARAAYFSNKSTQYAAEVEAKRIRPASAFSVHLNCKLGCDDGVIQN